MKAPTVTTPATETTLRRFTVAERLQRHRGRSLGEETEADRYAWIADSNALIREHLTYMKVRGGRLPGEYLRVLDWWPLEPWQMMQQGTAERLAALFGYLAAGGNLYVVEMTFACLGEHIEQGAKVGDIERLQTARHGLQLLGRALGGALGECMCERRGDGRGLRLVEWARRAAEDARQQREADQRALEAYEAQRNERRRAQLAAARAKAAEKRRARRAADGEADA